jgi:HK97 family phage portal protein
MGWFTRTAPPVPEQRASIEDPSVPISSANVMKIFGLDDLGSPVEPVSINSALGVPAVWAAVNFLSGTMASLPLHVYKRSGNDRERQRGQLALILNDAVSDEMSAFDWRKYVFDQVFTGGRSVTFIERNAAGQVMNLWPLDPDRTTVRRQSGRKRYELRENGKSKWYDAGEVIDLAFMMRPDQTTHRSPILANAEIMALAQAVTKHGAKFFRAGGVPPFAIEGPFQTAAGLARAADDLESAVKKAARENRLAITLPGGHTIKPIGADPEKSQLVETQRFLIEQIARIYSLPPVFLQDLTHGTFSNTEQQDLQLSKHTITRWATQFEKELNLKLFGRKKNDRFVEFNLDGLLRGDFASRMGGYATGIQNGVMTPNEVRRRENLSPADGGDSLMIQGATVPIKSQIDKIAAELAQILGATETGETETMQ